MKTWIISIAAVLVVLVGLLLFAAPDTLDIPSLTLHTGDPKNGLYQQSLRSLVFDYGDVVVYYQRSGWVSAHEFPYSYTDQEYPPLGILYFSLPRLVASSFSSYVAAYVVLTMLTFVILLYFAWKLLGAMQRSRWYMLGFLLPSFLYFVGSRFDVFAAAMVMAALLALQKKKFVFSMILIGLAMLIKWYPVFLVPFAIAWSVRQGVSRKEIIKGVLWSAVVFFGITALTLCFSGVAAGYPYGFHILRGIEIGSMPSVFLKLAAIAHVSIQSDAILIFMGLILFGIQLLPFLYGTIYYARMQRYILTFEDVVRFSVLAIILFVHVGKIYSPQWEIWWLPLALLVVKRPSEVYALIAVDILNYILFPILPVIYSGVWFRYAYFDSLVLLHFATILVFSLLIAKPLLERRRHLHGVEVGNSRA